MTKRETPGIDPLGNERGQAMTEYIVVTIVAMMPLLVFFYAMWFAMRRYIVPIYFFIGLPIP